MAKVVSRQIIRLSFKDDEVLVTPKDKSVFVINANKAVEACRDAVRLEERVEVFESDFLIPLHQWCVDHADHVSACYIPVPRGNIQVFIVTNTPAFDFGLAEEIADFELKLSQQGWSVGVSQLPKADENSLATFFNAEGALEVYAQCRSTQKESGTKP